MLKKLAASALVASAMVASVSATGECPNPQDPSKPYYCGTVAQPYTPPNFVSVTSLSSMCLMDGLTFTNGFSIIGTFTKNKFSYSCSCASLPAPYTTVARPHLVDSGSSAEVIFNDVVINSRTNSPPNAISNGGPDGVAPNSPQYQSNPMKLVQGTNVIKIGVGCNHRSDPNCYYQYTITCEGPQGSVVGDPQFVGLRGQSYQVHGVPNSIYNIVSDADLQYNARFVFLTKGDCPVVDGVQQKGCFSHAGTYLGELGLKTRAGDKIHIVTGPAAKGFEMIEVNNKPVEVGQTIVLADNMGSVSFNSSHVTQVQIGNWDFVFENSDMFLNQRVRVLDARGLRSHGMLGQTWRETTYKNAIKYIQGEVDDYVIREKDIWGDSFLYNVFN